MSENGITVSIFYNFCFIFYCGFVALAEHTLEYLHILIKNSTANA